LLFPAEEAEARRRRLKTTTADAAARTGGRGDVPASPVHQTRNGRADEHQDIKAKLEQEKEGRETRHRVLSTAKELTAARRTAAEKNRRWGRLRQREAARLGSNDAHGRGAPGCESNWTEVGWLWRI